MADSLLKALKLILPNKELPQDTKCQTLVKQRIKCQFEPSIVVIFLPQNIIQDALAGTHGTLLAGHDGI